VYCTVVFSIVRVYTRLRAARAAGPDDLSGPATRRSAS
jgi:hypothetical protein